MLAAERFIDNRVIYMIILNFSMVTFSGDLYDRIIIHDKNKT